MARAVVAVVVAVSLIFTYEMHENYTKMLPVALLALLF